MTYEITLHRVVEHLTTYRVNADSEEGEMEDPEVVDVVEV